MPETSGNEDIRDVLLKLSEDVQSLRQEVKNLNQAAKFSKAQLQFRANMTDRLIQGAIWVIITAGITSVVSNVTAVILESLSVSSI